MRHRSLQAALEWSHQLLSPRTQEVLHRLAVFPSGFCLLGAQLLMNVKSEADVIEHLTVLVDRSLVTFQPGSSPRYRLLETTRAFALDCLRSTANEVDWEERYALTMSKLCLLAARERDSSWMWQEMPNARAALAWALVEPSMGETAVTIATYTSVVLGAGGAIREALDNLLAVQHLVNEHCASALAARYWHWLGRLGVGGSTLEAITLHSERGELARNVALALAVVALACVFFLLPPADAAPGSTGATGATGSLAPGARAPSRRGRRSGRRRALGGTARRSCR